MFLIATCSSATGNILRACVLAIFDEREQRVVVSFWFSITCKILALSDSSYRFFFQLDERFLDSGCRFFFISNCLYDLNIFGFVLSCLSHFNCIKDLSILVFRLSFLFYFQLSASSFFHFQLPALSDSSAMFVLMRVIFWKI